MTGQLLLQRIFGLPGDLFTTASARFVRSVQLYESNFLWMCSVGGAFFPVYWFVWSHVFPQPYENLALRSVGMVLTFGLALSRYWPPTLRVRWLVPYAYVTLLFVFPFFFTYMTLMNGAVRAWVMSALVAYFLMILLIDWINVIVLFSLGTGAAYAAFYYATDGRPMPPVYVEDLTVILFLIVMGSLFNYRAEMLRRERARAMFLLGARMAHEMRTPLAGIKIGVSGIARQLERLFEKAGKEQRRRMAEFDHLKQDIVSQANYAGTIIDMLLLHTAPGQKLEPDELEPIGVREIVETTLANYPFISNEERALVVHEPGPDAVFCGKRTLVICVLYNLLKNSLFEVHTAGDGTIRIYAVRNSSEGVVHLYVRDTGPGIPPHVLPHVFDQFFTTKRGFEGAGVGLWNVRNIMESLGGRIYVRSQTGEYAEFELVFPLSDKC